MAKSGKTYVFILSTMRSGSTLLKALLAEAPDVSNIPEFNFHKIKEAKHIRQLHKLSDHPILVLKKPAWFQEAYNYPKVPRVKNWRIIVLTRDVHHVVSSIRKMSFGGIEPVFPGFIDHWFANEYWSRVYRRIHRKFGPQRNLPNVTWIRYEDLITDPLSETKRLFEFIGSEKTEGTNRYSEPEDYNWRWGSDDGGPTIQTLQVQPPKPISDRKRDILERVTRYKRVSDIRTLLGYVDFAEKPHLKEPSA